MTLLPRTRALLAIALVLVGLNLLDRQAPAEVDGRPVIAALQRDAVTRIEISDALEKVVLRQADGRWRVSAPYEADADQATVRALVSAFRKEVPVDVQVDTGNLDKYGLEPGKGIVVEFFTDGEAPAVSFTVGNDAAGGSTFVRLSGSEAIYRARVGGRARYERAPAEWRNKVLLDVEPDQVTALELRRDDLSLILQRGPSPGNDDQGLPKPGAWELEPPPPWPLDQRIADGLVTTLGRMRAGGVAPPEVDGGFSPPAATFTFTLYDGSTRSLVVGTREEQAATYARVEGREEVYRVAGNLRTLGNITLDDLRDKTLLSFSRNDVDTLAFEEGATRILLRQDLSTQLWQVIQPSNVDLDIRAVFATVNTLAALRGDSATTLSPESVGLARPAARFVITFVDGTSTALEIGDAATDPRGRPARYVRRAGSGEVFMLREEVVAKLKAGFGRS